MDVECWSVAASSISLSGDRQRALLVDFSCAVRQSTVNDDDLVNVICEVLPPHVISPEVLHYFDCCTVL